jgi:hypothetical protein
MINMVGMGEQREEGKNNNDRDEEVGEGEEGKKRR